ncbi:mannan endo-1,6-alpha-mannosidase DFG5 [Folsomia candida]|uniref:Uncharacterized protein n=1 Tax=Folsomia candida TaxID=158441 RepID=A0A226ERZ5_FOLCA|nr:mannan endo-1,6-alpha-mannosidase DFG5 [Folsomia candida]OXA59356.1 hypothetical protein Fcan01_04620 [Folsomia candida]
MHSSLITLPLLALLLFVGSQAQNLHICNTHCDNRDASEVSDGARVVATSTINGREIRLIISDTDNMGFAIIINGTARDEVWLDRSFDAGLSWENGSLLGFTTIPQGVNYATTTMFNVDYDAVKGLGALRACGRGLDPSPGPLTCTEWARSNVHSETRIDAAATALMQYFNGQLWHTVGWWNGANVLTALIQYMKFTDSRTHFHVIETAYTENLDGWDGNFTSDALDDTEWWALAWIDAYDVTGNQTYLAMAQFDADYIYQYVDSVCGGGVWWSTARTYKNAITNELYIQLAAALHNRIPGDTKYLAQAIEIWEWFKQSGMINEESLINDGLRDDCTSNRDTTWTYNQGVILGALVELYRATNDSTYLSEATTIADAVLQSPILTRNGVLTEPCEYSGQVGCGDHTGGCDCNQIAFKGIFLRHLGELNRNLGSNGQGPYQAYLNRQADTTYASNRNILNQYGIHFAGPLEDINASTQQSGLEAFTATLFPRF